jgi:predicted ester cyclase
MEDPMTQQEKNRALSLEVQKSMEDHAFERAEDLVAPEFRAYVAGKVLDRSAWTGMGQMFMKAFPDGHHDWNFVEATGDYVLLNGFFTGTHRAEFQGIPATGKVVKFSLTVIDKVQNGKLVEHRAEFDTATLMQQLAQ